jgi:hypothetical protein
MAKTSNQNFIIQKKLTNLSPKKVKIDMKADNSDDKVITNK